MLVAPSTSLITQNLLRGLRGISTVTILGYKKSRLPMSLPGKRQHKGADGSLEAPLGWGRPGVRGQASESQSPGPDKP